MSVYVDQADIPFRRMIMSHMVADTLDELHAMAASLGLRRAWFQPFSFPHYDVAKAVRADAVSRGAIEVDHRGIAEVMRRLRADPAFVDAWRAVVAK